VRRIAERLPSATVVAADLIAPDQAAQAFWAPIAGRVAERRLDVTDRLAVAGLMREARPTHVVHAAAVTPGLTRSGTTPPSYST
jgi:dTDP-4-dehydrorhamnose reductase